MAKVSANYEVVFILDPEVGEEGLAALVERFKTLISSNGELADVDEWGKRRLAYEINHKSEGYYVLMTFSSAPGLPAEISRISNITDGVIRSMVVCKDE